MPQPAFAPAPTLITGSTGARPLPRARRRSRAPVMVGGAAVVVGAVIVFGVLRASGPPRPGADSSAAALRPDSEPFGFNHSPAGPASEPTTATALPNGADGRQIAAKSAAAGSAPSATARTLDQRVAPTSEAGALSPAAIKAEIAAIRQLTLGERTAAEAVRRAEAMLPRLRTGDDSAEVLLQEFDAYVIRNDSSRSCNALKRIGKRGNSIVRESVVSGLSNC
jgi:hypothetical protein